MRSFAVGTGMWRRLDVLSWVRLYNGTKGLDEEERSLVLQSVLLFHNKQFPEETQNV